VNPSLPAGDYIEGVAFLLAVLGCVCAAAGLLVARRLPHLRGAPRVLAFAMLATLGLLAAHMVPGALGILTRGTVVAAAALVLIAVAAAVRGRAEVTENDDPPAPPTSLASAAVAVVAVAAAATCVVAFAAHEGRNAVANGDALTFHLTQIGRWIQDGSMWGINSFSPTWSWGAEPNTGVVVQLAFVLPFRADPFVRVPGFIFLALTAVSIHAVARELGAPRGPACTFAAVFVAIPAAMVPSLDSSLPDPIMWAAFGAGTLFLLRHARTGLSSDLLLCGIAYGIAFGTKWYGPLSVAVVLAVWGGAWLLARRPLPDLARAGAILAGLVAFCGGFWMLRNWVRLGNPLSPRKIAPLGVTVFDAPPPTDYDRTGYSIAHYFGSPHVWRVWILPGFKLAFAYSSAVICAGAALALGLGTVQAARDPARRLEAVRAAGVAVAAVLIGLVYLATPFTAAGPEGQPYLLTTSGRFVLPGLLLGAAAAAWACGRLPRAGVALEAAGAVLLVHAAARLYGRTMTHPFHVFAPKYVAAALGLAVLLGAGIALWRRMGARASGPARTRAVVGVAALLLVVAVALGHEQQKTFLASRYRGIDPTFEWVLDNAPGGHRIGLAGASGPTADNVAPWPMHGTRLRNRVEYVGPVVQGRVRRLAGARPFAAALLTGRYDLLLVGRTEPARAAPEEGWARAAGWMPVAGSGRYALFRRPAGSARLESPRIGGTEG
jgi:hypothetical protein